MSEKNSKQQQLSAAILKSVQRENDELSNRFKNAESIFSPVTPTIPKNSAPGTKEVAPTSPLPEVGEEVMKMTFTCSESDIARIQAIRKKAAMNDIFLNKSEVIRSALYALENVSEKQFLKSIDQMVKFSHGRPKNSVE